MSEPNGAGQGLRRAVSRYWFGEVSPYPLAAFRILYGVYLLAYFLRFMGRVEMKFSSAGVQIPFLIPDLAPPPVFAWLIYGATLATIIAFIAGWRTRIITSLLLGLFIYHWALCLAVHNTAFDRLNIVFLLVCCFGDLDGAWSLESLRYGGTRMASAWAQRLICLQIALLYFGTGLWKLLNPNWHGGEILYYNFSGSYGTPMSFLLVRLGTPLFWFALMSWSVIIFELVAGFALYHRRTRGIVIVVGIIFHVSNCLILYIPEFLITITAYVLFVDSGQVEAGGRRLADCFQRWFLYRDRPGRSDVDAQRGGTRRLGDPSLATMSVQGAEHASHRHR